MVLALLVVRVAPAAAQAYSLAPPPYQTVLNNSGAPVSNACVWTYAAGTTTPIATYSDAIGTTNTNPIRTDTAGRFTAYLTPGTGYKFVTELPCTPPTHGVVLRTSDNVAGTPSASVVTVGPWIPSLGGTTTYTTQTGTFVRVGALVSITATLTVNTIGTGSPYFVSGLPFPAADNVAGSVVAIGSAVSFTHLSTYLLGGASAFGVVGQAAAGMTDGYLNIFGNGTYVVMTMTYRTLAP